MKLCKTVRQKQLSQQANKNEVPHILFTDWTSLASNILTETPHTVDETCSLASNINMSGEVLIPSFYAHSVQ
jgi:hypothetical protein